MRFLRLEHRDIGALIAPDHLGREPPGVEQGHGNLAGVLDDVAVGDDIALARIDDDAGSGALKLALPHGGLFGASKKRRKNGSSGSGLFRGTRSVKVPRVAMFTTAGDAILIMGASEGTGLSPTAGGMPPKAGVTATATIRVRAGSARLMPDDSSPHGWAVERNPAMRQKTAPARGRRRRDRQCVSRSPRDLQLGRGWTVIFRGCLRALRNADLQHTVHVAGLDRLGVRALGQAEAAHEVATRALDALEPGVEVFFRAALAADRQHALVGGDLNILAFDTRQVGRDHEAVCLLADVDVRDPADARGLPGVSMWLKAPSSCSMQPSVEERPRARNEEWS